MSKPDTPKLPEVALDTFADIVEGRHPCPTLKDLALLAQSDLQEDLHALGEGVAFRSHLQKCPDCEEHYRALLLLARAAARAAAAVARERAG
jgi:hypothetical protein